jgi:hypothetical protein
MAEFSVALLFFGAQHGRWAAELFRSVKYCLVGGFKHEFYFP